VAQILASKCNCEFIDADKVGHETYEPGTDCYQTIIHQFGEGVRGDDGLINRKALGSIIFSDPSKKKELESIVWPAIRNKIIQKLEHFKSKSINTPVTVVLEAAIMIEAGWTDLVDSVWIPVVEPSVAIERLISRNGLTREDAERRLASQMTNEERKQFAHVLLDTNKPLAEVETDVIYQFGQLCLSSL